MPYLIETGGSDTRSVSKEFIPKISDRQHVFIDGMVPRPADVSPELPKGLRVGKPKRGGLPHIIGWSLGPWIVSEQVRDILEQLEPNTHSSTPIEIIDEETGTLQSIYYLLLATPIVDALDPAHTEWPRADAQRDSLYGVGKIALRRSAIVGRHLWKLPAPIVKTYFSSDELREKLLEHGLDGWKMQKSCVLV